MISLLLTVALASEKTPAGPELDVEWTPETETVDESGIIDGESAALHDFGASGGLIATFSGTFSGVDFEIQTFLCSASLIAPDVVLTAAHCVDPEVMLAQSGFTGVDITEARYGFARDVDLTGYGFGAVKDLPIGSGISWDDEFHEGWTEGGAALKPLSQNDDIGIIFLEEELPPPYAVLPTPEEGDAIAEGDPVHLVGYGLQTDGGRKSGEKMMGESEVMTVVKTELQVAAAGGTKICSGDSGGPTYAEVDTNSSEVYRQIGVHSYVLGGLGGQCVNGYDTRVDAYLDWIDDQMRSRCETGERTWCVVPGILPPPEADGSYAFEALEDWQDGPIAGIATSDEGAPRGCSQVPGPVSGLGVFLLPLLGIRRRR